VSVGPETPEGGIETPEEALRRLISPVQPVGGRNDHQNPPRRSLQTMSSTSAAHNDTFCRALLHSAASLSTNSSTDRCAVCLGAGCTWCKRAAAPFCWSGKAMDLANSPDPHANSCTSDYLTTPPDGSSSSDIASKCAPDQGLTTGVIVALIIWVLILICCVGGCCFAVWWFAYQRGKRHQAVHIDDYTPSQQEARAAHFSQPYYPQQVIYAGPLQTGVIVAGATNGQPLPVQQQSYFAGGGGGGDFTPLQKSHSEIPLVIATPL